MSPTDLKLPHPDLAFVPIQGGSFQMGGNERDAEQPIHKVTLPDFHLCRYQVTQELYEWVMDENPSRFKGGRRPVEQVSWDDAQIFIPKLNTKVKDFLRDFSSLDMAFRLPTESEWEYAARGGMYNKGCVYSGSDKLKQVGWYRDNSGDETHEVGLLRPNELSLYDMSGNVWEWCEDDYHSNYEYAPIDGSAWIDSPRAERRVLRGGSCFSTAVYCRPAFRYWFEPDFRSYYLGLRLALARRV